MKRRAGIALGVAAILMATTVLPALAKPTSRYRGKFVADAPINDKLAKGRVDWVADDKGRSRLKIRLQKVTDAAVNIVACGVDLGVVAVNGKSVRLDLRSKKGDLVPDCSLAPTINVTAASGLNMNGALAPKS